MVQYSLVAFISALPHRCVARIPLELVLLCYLTKLPPPTYNYHCTYNLAKLRITTSDLRQLARFLFDKSHIETRIIGNGLLGS